MLTAQPKLSAPDGSEPTIRWWQRPLVIGVVLFAVYGIAAALTMADGYLSTDVGGKVATLEAMDARGDWIPDIGYWAAEFDPDGSLHPYYKTVPRSGGIWVNVTTLPMLLVARPLWALGGFPLTLLLPIAGSVAAALGAGALEREWSDEGSGPFGWQSAWIVGLASPMAIYALDFWEHSLGVALMTWGVLWSFKAMRTRAWRWSLAAGLAFGSAATLRQEVILFGLVVGVLVLWQCRRKLVVPAMLAVGTLVPLVANGLLEVALMGSATRAERGAEVATTADREWGNRLLEVGISAGAPLPDDTVLAAALGLGLFVSLFLVGYRSQLGQSIRQPMVASLVILSMVALRLALSGLPEFVPGLVSASPLAGIGFGAMATLERRRYLVAAIGPLPLVWLFQFAGPWPAQWGARYLLVAGVLGVVGAVVWLNDRRVVRMMVVVGAVITMGGVTWVGIRGADIAQAKAEVAAIDAPVTVIYDAHTARELGTLTLHRRLLSAPEPAQQAEAARLLIDAGFDRSAWIVAENAPAPELGFGWEVVATGQVRWGTLGVTDVYYYER